MDKKMFVAGYKPACRNKPNSTMGFNFCGAKETPFTKFGDLLPWIPHENATTLVNKDLCVYITYKYDKKIVSDLVFQGRDCATTFATFAFEIL